MKLLKEVSPIKTYEENVETVGETVYEKHEILNVVQKWIKTISNPDQTPWSDYDLGRNSSLILKATEHLDPFHGFDWNKSSSHKGRLMKLMLGSYNRQG